MTPTTTTTPAVRFARVRLKEDQLACRLLAIGLHATFAPERLACGRAADVAHYAQALGELNPVVRRGKQSLAVPADVLKLAHERALNLAQCLIVGPKKDEVCG